MSLSIVIFIFVSSYSFSSFGVVSLSSIRILLFVFRFVNTQKRKKITKIRKNFRGYEYSHQKSPLS